MEVEEPAAYAPGQVVKLCDDGSLKKEVIKVGQGEGVPKRGDTVFVHYVGKLEDGTIFDSSRDRNEPFRFPVGRGRVIKGWDIGIATMRKGEKANLVCPPLYAYGARGSPPKIPPEATLHFEVEILKWISGDDLTGDTGVMKKILVKGDKWQSPKEGDEVTISWVGRVDGVEFGSQTGQVLSLGKTLTVEAFKKALLRMKKKEKALLTVTSEYAKATDGIGAPPADANVTDCIEYELTLHTWDPIDDVTGDSGVLKKVVRKGEGWKTPKDGDEVTISYLARTMDGTEYESKSNHSFLLGTGQFSSGLEKALLRMKKKEHAQIKAKPAYLQEGTGGYPGAPDKEASFDVVLEKWSEISVVDPVLGIKKKILKDGVGYESPKDLGFATVSVSGSSNGKEFLSLTNQSFRLVTGEDVVPWALEKAILTMKRGETSSVTVNGSKLLDSTNTRMYGEVDAVDTAEFTVTCHNFTKVKEAFELENTTEKVDAALEYKQIGNGFWTKNNFPMANRHYTTAYEILKDIDMKDTKDPEFDRANVTRIAVTLNLAAARLQQKQWKDVPPILTPLISKNPYNVKALFRRAQAYYFLKMYELCIEDCEAAARVEPSQDFKELWDAAEAKADAAAEAERDIWSSALSQGLGTLYDDKPAAKPLGKKEAPESTAEELKGDEPMEEIGGDEVPDAANPGVSENQAMEVDRPEEGGSGARVEELND